LDLGVAVHKLEERCSVRKPSETKQKQKYDKEQTFNCMKLDILREEGSPKKRIGGMLEDTIHRVEIILFVFKGMVGGGHCLPSVKRLNLTSQKRHRNTFVADL